MDLFYLCSYQYNICIGLIYRSTTPDYTHKMVSPTPDIITITILKGSKELSVPVDIGEQLTLQIKGPGKFMLLLRIILLTYDF